jgi:DNA-binding response OmpR family regulator
MLRRAYPSVDQTLNVLQYHDLIVNMERMQVFYKDAEADLTRNECRILSMLVKKQGIW